MARDASLDNKEFPDRSALKPQVVTSNESVEAVAQSVEDTCLCALLGSSRCGRH